jgi:hypothetical protein
MVFQNEQNFLAKFFKIELQLSNKYSSFDVSIACTRNLAPCSSPIKKPLPHVFPRKYEKWWKE